MTTHAYEAMFILKVLGQESAVAEAQKQIDTLVQRIGAKIEHKEDMGRRRLAYTLERNVEGHYYLLRFTAPTEKVRDLERDLRLNDTIIRFMILTRDKTTETTAESIQETAHRVEA